MYLRDLENNEYLIASTYTIEDDVEGNIVLSTAVAPNKVNNEFIAELSEFWEIVDDDDVIYKIRNCRTKGEGEKQYKDIKAIPKAHDDLQRKRVYERYDGSFSIDRLLRIIFEPTGYTFRMLNNWENIKVEGFGEGDTCLNLLKYVLERIGAEFYFVDKSFTILEKMGTETDIMYRYRLNASNIVRDVDAQEYYTYARGYGDYRNDDKGWENAKLIREYKSQFYNYLGEREAPPIKNANITKKETMDEKLKTLVDNSIKISVTADLVDLRKQNYPYAQSNRGDTVFLIDERFNFSESVRVIKRAIKRNFKGDILDVNFTFGSEGIVDRYQNKTSNAVNAMIDILEGRKKMPFAAMAHEIQILTGLMLNVQTQFEIAENGSILAINKKNPNDVVIYNANGLFVSIDGGQTPKAAITARGIMGEAVVANSITADKLDVNAITVGFNNYSKNIELWHDRIDLFRNNQLKARLASNVLEFYNNGKVIGKIDSYLDSVFLSTNKNGFVGLGQDLRDENGNGFYSYNILVDPNHKMGNFDIKLIGSVQVNYKGLHDLHDALNVGTQFKGQTLMIPTFVNSDGTIGATTTYSF